MSVASVGARRLHAGQLAELLRRGVIDCDWPCVAATTSVLLRAWGASSSGTTASPSGSSDDAVWQSTLLLLQQHPSLKRHAWRYLQQQLAGGMRRELILLEMALALVRMGEVTEAYDCVNGRIELQPFSGNAVFHGYLGLMAMAIADAEARKAGSERRSETMLERAAEHFRRAAEIDSEAELFVQMRLIALARTAALGGRARAQAARRAARTELTAALEAHPDNLALWQMVYSAAALPLPDSADSSSPSLPSLTDSTDSAPPLLQTLLGSRGQSATWRSRAARHMALLDPACPAAVFDEAMDALTGGAHGAGAAEGEGESKANEASHAAGKANEAAHAEPRLRRALQACVARTDALPDDVDAWRHLARVLELAQAAAADVSDVVGERYADYAVPLHFSHVMEQRRSKRRRSAAGDGGSGSERTPSEEDPCYAAKLAVVELLDL